MNQAEKTGWWSRNWKWLVPVGCFSVCLLVVGFLVLVLSFAFGVMKANDAYRLALARAQASPAVAEVLGAPIHEGWFVSGNVSVTGPSGHAELSIPLAGPKGRGTLYLEARKSVGEWSFSKLVLKTEPSGRRIDLLAEPGKLPDTSGGGDRRAQPRYAASTRSFLFSSAGVPSRAIRPRSMT